MSPDVPNALTGPPSRNHSPLGGVWFVNGSAGAQNFAQWGGLGDRPVSGDYDGDGRNDFTVFRPVDNHWYVNQTTAGPTAVQWGTFGDQPVPDTER